MLLLGALLLLAGVATPNAAQGVKEKTMVDLKGRLSNPPQRRLSPIDIDDLLDTYRARATINQLAVDYGIHRTAVTGHLDRHGVPVRPRRGWAPQVHLEQDRR